MVPGNPSAQPLYRTLLLFFFPIYAIGKCTWVENIFLLPMSLQDYHQVFAISLI